tara:strand:- start:732 stop:1745 length:1014 start_codon:yes stop_codon:yes gene_type:complete
MNQDKFFMNIALDEARKASDMVYPNPRVGCVIVQNGEIVSRGYHKQYGGPHAEVDAINNCKVELNKATMYVTLEPCNHEGKTPPCTELIDSQKFERIVIACKDPNPIINNGLQALMKKGLTIDFNVCEDEAKFINKRFFTYHEKKRPYVILKYASTLDGFISEESGHSKWITSKKSRHSVHILRSSCDAILVGRKTVEADNPSLTSHNVGSDPRIVILDPSKKINKEYQSLKKNTIHFTSELTGKTREDNIQIILTKLHSLNIQSVLVEGGATTLTSFINHKTFDEMHVYYAPKLIGKGISIYNTTKEIHDSLNLQVVKHENFDNDIKITYFNTKAR